MDKSNKLLRITLVINGIVDVFCAAILLVLPLLNKPLLGYRVFDSQGAFMAGGWGVATLALAVGRIWGSSRPTSHTLLLIMGIFEGTALAVYSGVQTVLFDVPFIQILLPLLVGVIFGSLYWMCLIRKK